MIKKFVDIFYNSALWIWRLDPVPNVCVFIIEKMPQKAYKFITLFLGNFLLNNHLLRRRNILLMDQRFFRCVSKTQLIFLLKHMKGYMIGFIFYLQIVLIDSIFALRGSHVILYSSHNWIKNLFKTSFN